MILFGVLAAAVILLAGALGRRSADNTIRARTNEERIAYLQSLGWEVEPAPLLEQEITLPKEFPDVLTQTAAPTNEDELWEDVRSVAEQAVDAFIAMRAVEGEKMKADVSGRLTTIETLVGQIEENSAGRVQAYSDKLYARLQELLGDRSIDEGRLVTEAAIFADKTAIDEETVRLHSHVAQYREILALDEPIGRKLDFLTQELNRESNTIGSKCQDVAITRLVVELKSEIEKIREQIQNIE